jgi:small subunit ribosomal protein S6
MTNYELLFIVDPTLEEARKEEVVETVKGIVAADGEVGDVDVWGMKKLAYPIQKHEEGYYAVIKFAANPEHPREIDRRLKISDDVMRHIIVNLDE